jgi:hypothetical protein
MKKSIILNPDEIQNYIKDLRKIPVMSHERQDEIFELLIYGNRNRTQEATGANETSSRSHAVF